MAKQLEVTLKLKMEKVPNSNEFNVLTYNMHGYNQGCEFLKEVCSIHLYDVIFIQEHWLTSPNIQKMPSTSTK